MVGERYQLQDGELVEEYEMRVCKLGKSERLTWQEIANIINEETGRTSDESTYRRRYRDYLVGLKEGAEYAVRPEEQIVFTDEDKQLRDRMQRSTEMVPYYRLMRQDSRFERFYKEIAAEIKRLPVPAYKYPEYEEPSEKHYILGLADLHIGANFNGVNNSYSIEEADRRFGVLFNYMRNFIEEHKITRLSVLSLGDVVQNILRISDLKLNEVPVVDAFVAAMRMISNFINELSAYCNIDFYMVCYSNHDQLRPLGTKASELAGEDLGKILYAYLRDVLADNKRVNIISDTTTDRLKFNIFGFKCAALHGHQVNNPQTINKDITNRDREFYDYIFLGHTHSAREIITAEGEHHNIQTLTLGSFVGSCPYADKLMVGSKASCSIFGFDKKYGHVETYTCILN